MSLCCSRLVFIHTFILSGRPMVHQAYITPAGSDLKPAKPQTTKTRKNSTNPMFDEDVRIAHAHARTHSVPARWIPPTIRAWLAHALTRPAATSVQQPSLLPHVVVLLRFTTVVAPQLTPAVLYMSVHPDTLRPHAVSAGPDEMDAGRSTCRKGRHAVTSVG
jgi:hypothetical protein